MNDGLIPLKSKKLFSFISEIMTIGRVMVPINPPTIFPSYEW